MDKKAVLAQREYFKFVHGVTLRAIGTLTDDELDFRPKEGMRSPKELMYHVYAMERGIAAFVRTGKLPLASEELAIPETEGGKKVLETIRTVADLIGFAGESHALADKTIEEMSEEEIRMPVEAPYGTFPAFQFFTFAYDEHWHHRGQFYTYLRLLGKEGPMIYDYEGNKA